MATKLEKQIIQKMDGTRTFGSIGKEFGLSYQIIKTIADKNGIARPKSVTKAVKLEQEVIKQVNKGNNIKYIAKKLNVTVKEINKIIDKIIDNNSIREDVGPCETTEMILNEVERLGLNSAAALLGIRVNVIKKIVTAKSIAGEGRTLKAKLDRNKELCTLLIETEMTYTELGKSFGISKARVQQFAKANGVSRWEYTRKKKQELAEKINADYKAGLSYDEIVERNDLRNVKLSSLKKYGCGSVFHRFRKERNKNIVKEYKKDIAKNVLKSNHPAMNNPERVVTLGSVYAISGRDGFKKYPNVGNRNAGGVFEKPEIIKFIKTKRDKHKLPFSEIAILIQTKGWLTPCGKEYSASNVYQKYNAIKKHKA